MLFISTTTNYCSCTTYVSTNNSTHTHTPKKAREREREREREGERERGINQGESKDTDNILVQKEWLKKTRLACYTEKGSELNKAISKIPELTI